MSKKKINVLDLADIESSSWIRVHAEGLKTHYVYKSYLTQLVVDLESRGHNVFENVPTNACRIEFPAYAYFTNRPEETITIDGLTVNLPSRDVAISIEIMAELDARFFRNGDPYFKLKSERSCIVFNPEQYEAFMYGLVEISEQANERDREFLDKVIKGSDD